MWCIFWYAHVEWIYVAKFKKNIHDVNSWAQIAFNWTFNLFISLHILADYPKKVILSHTLIKSMKTIN